MKINESGLELLAECEGLKLQAYKCLAGKWTIGLGNTFYENGKSVKQGDKITKERAFQLFWNIEKKFSDVINSNVKIDISQNQFNALFIFAWNVGTDGFKKSTLLKRVNSGCNDTLIEEAFLMWKGKKNILLTRRKKEIREWKKK